MIACYHFQYYHPIIIDVEDIGNLIVIRLCLRLRGTSSPIQRLTRFITDNFVIANILIF